MAKKTEITDYMRLTYELMQWAKKDPSKRGILVVTYDDERNLTGAVPAGNLVRLGVAIANEMKQNKMFRSIIEGAVEAYEMFNDKSISNYLHKKERQELLSFAQKTGGNFDELYCSLLQMKTSEKCRINTIEYEANKLKKLILYLIGEFERETNTSVKDIGISEEVVKDELGNSKFRQRNLHIDAKIL